MSRSSKLRVLQIGKFYWPHKGGIESHIQTLCQTLQKHLDVRVLVANECFRTAETVIEQVPVVRSGTLLNIAATPVCPAMVRSIRNTPADIVHMHCPNPWAMLAFLLSGHRGKLVVSYHSDVVRQRLMYKAFEPVLYKAMDVAAAVIASSPNYIESSPVLAEYRSKCHVIPIGITPEEYDYPEPAAVERIRHRYGPRLVLGVGRLVYYKGFTHLIQAMKQVDGHLVIVGDGPLRHALETQIEAEGVRDRVTILSGVENVLPYYHAADVFVLASNARSEAFGIVQLEAMASGTPVINTALDSGVPFVSVHGTTGLTVPPSDPEALASAISLLLDDRDLRDRYGRAARARVRHEFSLEDMAERNVQLYQRIMGLSDSPLELGAIKQPDRIRRIDKYSSGPDRRSA